MAGARDLEAGLGQVSAHAVAHGTGRRRILNPNQDQDVRNRVAGPRQHARVADERETDPSVEPRLDVGRIPIGGARHGLGQLVELLVQLIGQVLVHLEEGEVPKEALQCRALVAGKVEAQLVIDRRVRRHVRGGAACTGVPVGQDEPGHQSDRRREHDHGSRAGEQPARSLRGGDGRRAAGWLWLGSLHGH